MNRIAAEQYRKSLAEVYEALCKAQTLSERAPLAARIQNLAQPLFVVDTFAAQHLMEAASKLHHPQLPIVNASLETIRTALARLDDVITKHPHEHFVIYGPGERLFVKPVAGEELQSMIEKGRLLHHEHGPFVHAFDASPSVERVMIDADIDTLRPVFSRLGFPHADALAFFTTRAHPTLGKPAENMPSVTICTIRSGVPVRVVKHRSLR